MPQLLLIDWWLTTVYLALKCLLKLFNLWENYKYSEIVMFEKPFKNSKGWCKVNEISCLN